MLLINLNLIINKVLQVSENIAFYEKNVYYTIFMYGNCMISIFFKTILVFFSSSDCYICFQ